MIKNLVTNGFYILTNNLNYYQGEHISWNWKMLLKIICILKFFYSFSKNHGICLNFVQKAHIVFELKKKPQKFLEYLLKSIFIKKYKLVFNGKLLNKNWVITISDNSWSLCLHYLITKFRGIKSVRHFLQVVLI